MDLREIGWKIVSWIHLAKIGSSEHGNEPSCSIKGKEFFDKLSDYKLINKDSYPWFLLSLAPQPGLGLGLLQKIWLNFLEAS
jgi:hypothetical protein